ncbi:MAG: prepilin-type N-terminal cleavage/methylation domain-containing protein [Endomicrobiales bacterium]|jgi:type IV pilus assembly protein PilA
MNIVFDKMDGMNTMLYNRRNPTRGGFTLIELVVVVIIIGMLAAASVPIYHLYIRKSTLSEGRACVGSIANAEKVYYTEFNNVIASGTVASPITASSMFGIDITTNKYFTTFAVPTVAGNPGPTASYTGYAIGSAGDYNASGLTVTIIQTMNSFPTITDNS